MLQLVPEVVLPGADKAAVYREAERIYPALWKRCYPRIYREYKPGEYCSPKDISFTMLSAAKKVEYGAKVVKKLGYSDIHEIQWASAMAAWRTPLYWVEREFAEAVRLTVPPYELDWYHMGMPYPAAAFLLPKGLMRHGTEGDVRWIGYARQHQSDAVPSLAEAGPNTWGSVNGLFVLIAATESNLLTHWTLPYDNFPTVNLADLDACLHREKPVDHKSILFTNSLPDMGPDDDRLSVEVAHMIFGLLLLMQKKPQVLTAGSCISKIPPKHKGEPPKEVWSPSVVGKNYAMRRVGVTQGGTHASPRLHPVRGHYKDIRYGPGLSLVKPEEWIEPYWRGLEKDEEV
jgi:hypothetical protein